MDRLPSLKEEILRIGSDKIDMHTDAISKTDAFSMSNDKDQAVDQKMKEIEAYPRPLAVVGVSVL